MCECVLGFVCAVHIELLWIHFCFFVFLFLCWLIILLVLAGNSFLFIVFFCFVLFHFIFCSLSCPTLLSASLCFVFIKSTRKNNNQPLSFMRSFVFVFFDQFPRIIVQNCFNVVGVIFLLFNHNSILYSRIMWRSIEARPWIFSFLISICYCSLRWNKNGFLKISHS